MVNKAGEKGWESNRMPCCYDLSFHDNPLFDSSSDCDESLQATEPRTARWGAEAGRRR